MGDIACTDSAHLNGRVTAQQLQGTDGGALVGVQRLATEAGDLAVRGNLQAAQGKPSVCV